MNKKLLAVIAVVILVIAVVAAAVLLGGKKAEPGKPKPPKNRAPVPAFEMSSARVLHNSSVTFNASLSSDPDGNNITCSWNFGDGAASSGKVVFHTYTVDGTYSVNLTVSDGKLSNSTARSLEVFNGAPGITDALPSGAITTIPEGEGLNFTINASDPNGDPLAFSWKMNNQTLSATSTLLTLSTNYTSAGNYTVRATVSDGRLEASREWALIVMDVNRPPALVSSDPAGNITIAEGGNSTFQAMAADPDNDELSFVWKLDGSGALNGTGREAAFTYAPDYSASGIHSLSVSFTDGKASVSRSWGMNVSNVNRPPVITSFSPAPQAEVIETYSKDFSVNASDPDGDFITYNWTLDGVPVSVTGTFTYLTDYHSAGNHTVKVTVSDDWSSVGQGWNVTVLNLNRPPTAVAVADPLNVSTGENITFNGSGSWDPDNDTLAFEWVFANGNTSTDMVAVHAFALPGTYKVNLTVTDPYAATSLGSVTVNVTQPPPPTGLDEVWKLGPLTESPAIMLVEDVDADGAKEIVLATTNGTDANNNSIGHITIYNLTTRQVVWQSPDIGAATAMVAVNIDGDAALEIVVGVLSNTTGDLFNGTNLSGMVKVFDGATHSLEREAAAPGGVVSLAVADINSDGQKEVLVGHSYNLSLNTTTFSVVFKGGLAVYSPTLSLLWNSTGWGMTVVMAAENIDGDPAVEVVLGSITSMAFFGASKANLSVSEWSSGKLIESVNHTEAGGLLPNVYLVKDIDGNGDKEILVGDSRSTGSAFSGQLYVFDHDLGLVWKSSDIGGFASIAAANIDGQAGLEILVGVAEEQISSTFTGCMVVFNPAGNELWRTGNIGRPDVIAPGDLNGDGYIEVAVGCTDKAYSNGRSNATLRIFNGTSHKEVTNLTGFHTFAGRLFALVDPDGDGSMELLFVDWDGFLETGYIRLYTLK